MWYWLNYVWYFVFCFEYYLMINWFDFQENDMGDVGFMISV